MSAIVLRDVAPFAGEDAVSRDAPGGGAGPMTDVAFALSGRSVPAEHVAALARALWAVLPWLEDDARSGVHPLRTCGCDGEWLLLAQRTRLVLRVPVARVPGALALAGSTLMLSDVRLGIGRGTVRPLQPWPTLYAQHVVTDAPDAPSFEAQVGATLRARGVRCGVLAGRAAHRRSHDGNLAGFSLLLHGLADADSLALQCDGTGPARQLGCGIFVPHKSVAAVG